MTIALCFHASREIFTSPGVDACVLSVESGVDAAVSGCRGVGAACVIRVGRFVSYWF